MKKQIRAAVYVRYSSQQQNDSFSIEYQIEETTKYIELKGYKHVETYIDAAKTGKKTAGREALEQMTNDVKNGKIDKIVVFSFSRSFRNTRDALNYNHDLMENYGVTIESVIEPIDLSNPHGKFSGTNLFAMHELQSDIIAAHVRSGMYIAAQKGYFLGGTPPFGYDLIGTGEYSRGKERKKYCLHDENAAIVRRIFKMYADGLPISAILTMLSEKEITARRGGAMNKSTVAKILRNEFYIGTRQFEIKGYPKLYLQNAVPAIIDVALWARVQKRHAEKKTTQPRRRKSLYCLTGKIFCGCCDSPFTGVSMRPQNGNIYNYYSCAGRHEKRVCNNKNIRKLEIEKYCLQQIRENILNPDAIKQIAASICKNVSFDPDETRAKISKLKNRREKINGIIKKIRRDIYENEISKTDGGEMISDYETELNEIEILLTELQTALTDAVTPENVTAYLNELLTLSGHVEPEIIKSIFDKLIDRVVVNTDSVNVYLRVAPFGVPVMFNDSSALPNYALNITDERAKINDARK